VVVKAPDSPAPGAGGAVLLEQEAGSGGTKVARKTDDFSLYNYYHDLSTYYLH